MSSTKPPESEADFQAAVLELALLLGWRRAHFRPARAGAGWSTPVQGDGEGFPDLVLVRAGRLIFAELKSARGRVSAAQRAWLHDLNETGAEVYIWRPADWEAIRKLLERDSHRRPVRSMFDYLERKQSRSSQAHADSKG